MAICLLGCKKEETTITFNGDGFLYNDGSPFVGGVGWYLPNPEPESGKH